MELAAYIFVAWYKNNWETNATIKRRKGHHNMLMKHKTVKGVQEIEKLPSPYDAIVRGEERSFWVMEAISFKVTSSTAFKK